MLRVLFLIKKTSKYNFNNYITKKNILIQSNVPKSKTKRNIKTRFT